MKVNQLSIARCALLCLTLLCAKTLQAQRPNIIYIMTDDMGYGDLSCYGNKKFTTPHLDRLAAQGVKFSNAYAAAPVCTPTRTALITGRYPAKTPLGLLEPLRSPKKDSAFGITKEIPSLGAMMKASGYETVLIGKWHLGFMPHQSPMQNGFDYFFGIHSGGADYISHKGENGTRVHDLYENDTLNYTEGYLTDLFSQKAVSFIKQKHQKPFFLMLTYTAPHWPWQGPTDLPYPDSLNFSSGGSPEIYEAMMKSLDDGIGSIMAALDEQQLKNTLVIFTNDNGGEKYSDNGGLTQAKFTLWEGGIRVPAIVRWPGKISEGITSEQVVTTMDWTATMLKAAKAKTKKKFPLDGIDVMPVLTGKVANIDRTLYWRVFQRKKQKAVRDGKWKYLIDEKGEYLFDLSIDREEKNNLKDVEKARFEKMKLMLVEWEKTLLAPIPL
jgi:arylsulfatase A-like enzyme